MIAATLVLLAAHMIVPRLRSWSAAQRHLLWAASLAIAAIVPLLGLVLPLWQPEWAARLADAWPPALDSLRPWASVRGAEVVVRTTGIETAPWNVGRWWLPLWMAGTGVALVLLTRDVARLVHLARGAEPLVEPRFTEACRTCARELHLSRVPALLVSPRAVMPMTWGIRRPRVLLPAKALDWPAGRIRAVLAHELAHVGRADWPVHLVAQLACAIYWFNPLFWTAERALGRETELAADDEALGAGLEAGQYATDMMEVVRASRPGVSPRAPVLAMARSKHLERRIAALLQPRANRARVSRRAGAATAVLSFVIVLVAAITTGEAIDVDVRAVSLPVAIHAATSVTQPATPTVRASRAGQAGRIAPPEIEEYTTPPLYSDEARRRSVEGMVTIGFRVDEDGRVSGARVVNGLGFGLDQNALVALRQWRFRSGRRNGTPAAMDAVVDLEFSLRSEGVNELIANDMATLVGPGVVPPRVVRTSRVPLRAAGAHGLVILDVVLQQDGSPRIVRILRSLTPEADERAVRHFEQWRFSPAMKGGVPVKVRMNAEVRFP